MAETKEKTEDQKTIDTLVENVKWRDERIQELESQLSGAMTETLLPFNDREMVFVADEIEPDKGVFLYHESHSFKNSSRWDVTQIWDWAKQTVERALSTGANGLANNRFRLQKVLVNKKTGQVQAFTDEAGNRVAPEGDGYVAQDRCLGLPAFSKGAKLHVRIWLEYPVEELN